MHEHKHASTHNHDHNDGHSHDHGHHEDGDCEICNPHVEYCDVCGESLARCNCVMPDEKMEKRVYILKGLDCANCAAKVEAKIRQMPEVEYASVAYANKQMRLSANRPDVLIPSIQKAIDAMEDGITVLPKEEVKKEAKKGEKSSAISEKYRPLIMILGGAAEFLVGFLAIHIGGLEESDIRLLPILIVSYLMLGGKVLMTAGRNMKKGQIFDENFLMCIATLGAFVIREFPERLLF